MNWESNYVTMFSDGSKVTNEHDVWFMTTW